MAPKEKNQKQVSLFFSLRNTLHTKHSLFPTLTVFIHKTMIINLMPFWLGTTFSRKVKEKFSGYLEGDI